jgi:hypothetical protein
MSKVYRNPEFDPLENDFKIHEFEARRAVHRPFKAGATSGQLSLDAP